MSHPQLYRGRIRCSKCGFEPIHAITQKELELKAYCWSCIEKLNLLPEVRTRDTAAWPTGLHVQWDLVEKATIHRLNEPKGGDYSRRGTVLSFLLRDIGNNELAASTAIEVCQYVMFFASHHGISQLGKEGEQNYAWVNAAWSGSQRVGIIEHKNLGDDEMECMRDLVRLLAKRHGWRLEDELVLEALAATAPEKPKRRRKKT